MSLEAEVMELRAGSAEQRALVRGRDKLFKENQELRAIISTQDEQVSSQLLYIRMAQD